MCNTWAHQVQGLCWREVNQKHHGIARDHKTAANHKTAAKNGSPYHTVLLPLWLSGMYDYVLVYMCYRAWFCMFVYMGLYACVCVCVSKKDLRMYACVKMCMHMIARITHARTNTRTYICMYTHIKYTLPTAILSPSLRTKVSVSRQTPFITIPPYLHRPWRMMLCKQWHFASTSRARGKPPCAFG